MAKQRKQLGAQIPPETLSNTEHKVKTRNASKKQALNIIKPSEKDAQENERKSVRRCCVKLQRIKLPSSVVTGATQAQVETRRQKQITRSIALQERRTSCRDYDAAHASKSLSGASQQQQNNTHKPVVTLRRIKKQPLAMVTQAQPQHARQQISKKQSLQEQHGNRNANVVPTVEAPKLKHLLVKLKRVDVNAVVPKSKESVVIRESKSKNIQDKENTTQDVTSDVRQPVAANENQVKFIIRTRRAAAKDQQMLTAQKKNIEQEVPRLSDKILPIKQLSVEQRNGLKKLSLLKNSSEIDLHKLTNNHIQLGKSDGKAAELKTGINNITKSRVPAANLTNHNEQIVEKVGRGKQNRVSSSQDVLRQSPQILKEINAAPENPNVPTNTTEEIIQHVSQINDNIGKNKQISPVKPTRRNNKVAENVKPQAKSIKNKTNQQLQTMKKSKITTNSSEKKTGHASNTSTERPSSGKEPAELNCSGTFTVSKISEGNTSSKNLINNSDAIEALLLAEEENEMGNTIVQSKHTSSKDKASDILPSANTHKFFHREITQPKMCSATTKPLLKRTSNKQRAKQRYTAGRGVSVGNVYEFLSQSQTSDSDNAKHIDPAADIIQKLIAEGKVRVATRRKGTGRPIMKRVMAKKRLENAKRLIRQKKATTDMKVTENIASVAIEDDGFDYDNAPGSPLHSFDVEAEQQEQSAGITAKHIVETNNNNQSKNGTFSHLARTVLLHEANKNDSAQKKLAEKRRLLEVARKFVSTPVNRNKNVSTLQTADISPISAVPLQSVNASLTAPSSPWRVPEEALLPSVFHFSKNSSHLPSFSSDFIPPTPRKKVQFESSKNENSSLAPLQLSQPTDVLDADMPSTSAAAAAGAVEMNTTSTEQLSSFTSNDSNAENLPPPAHVPARNTYNRVDENEDIFNSRQQSNPRRTYSHRSPLKAINILEVVTLPPWKNVENQTNEGTEKPIQNEKESNKVDASVENLFGFDEFLDSEESDEEAQSKVSEASLATSYVDSAEFRKKLRKLKKWRPTEANLPLEGKEDYKPIRRIFDNDEGRPRQRGIKEMFCSTMIQPTKPKEVNVLDSDDDESDVEYNENKKEVDPEVELFSDPETTFNTTQPRRTYGRQYKKKRKLRHNFVMFLDSDESGEEENIENEHDKSDDKNRKHRKIHHKATLKEKRNPELDTFVHEFNDMCKEVDQYNLIVE